MKSRIEEIDSTYNNISFITYANNLVSIVNKYPHAGTNKNELSRVLNSFEFNDISTALSNNISIITLIRILILYNKHCTGYNTFILRDFIKVISQGYMDKVITITSKIKHNKGYIAYNFYSEQLLKYSVQEPKLIKESVLEYAGAFYHFTMLLIIFYVLHGEVTKTSINKLFLNVKEQACMGILSGFEAYTELALPYPYGAIIEELLTLTSSDEKKLAITGNPYAQAIEFKILDNIIFQERYYKEGYLYEGAIWDSVQDSKVKNLFRICKGSRQNSIKLIYLKASGQRTIGRLLGFNEDALIRSDELYDSGMCSIKNMLCFCLMAILENCNPVDYKQSLYIPLDNLVQRLNNKGKRYVTEKIAVISLLALHPELKEQITGRYFIHKDQREELLHEVAKLRKRLNSKQEPILIKFVKDIRRSYVW